MPRSGGLQIARKQVGRAPTGSRRSFTAAVPPPMALGTSRRRSERSDVLPVALPHPQALMMEEREYLGSLLMASPERTPTQKMLPRDEHGFPYQVVLMLHPGGHGTKDLKRDEEGRILGWQMSADGRPGPGMRPVPPEVAEAAIRWLDDYR